METRVVNDRAAAPERPARRSTWPAGARVAAWWRAGGWAQLRLLAEGVALFALCLALFGIVQFGTPALADNDGYYHMKMGWLIRQQGLTPAFTWLPLSILNRDAFYNHHLLYQVYLGLFAGDGSEAAMIQGAKLASIMMPSLACLALWWLLRSQHVPWAFLWTVGLFAASEAFLYRMSQPRAQAAALLVMVLALHWLLQRRYLRLAPLGFVFVWLYNAFPLLLVVAGVYVAAALLTERRLEWQALLYPAVGIALGLIINPYFPQNISFIISHIVPKITDPTTTSVGNEWYPYQTWTLVQNSGVALALWLLGVLAIGWRGRQFDRATLTMFGLSVVFGYLLFQSRRFIEYWPPFALAFAALSIGPLLGAWLHRSPISEDGQEATAPAVQQPQPVASVAHSASHAARVPQRPMKIAALAVIPSTMLRAGGYRLLAAFMVVWLKRLALSGAVLGVAGLVALTLPQARALMAESRPADTYADASHWLVGHTSPGTMVFQTDWDDFPRLFFYNTSSVYTAGLDPTYMELFDRQLYDQWVDITRGKIERPGKLIHERFGATYVLSDHDHTAFLRQARNDPRLEEVYRDQYAVIFRVVP
jgi:hypothetical protein